MSDGDAAADHGATESPLSPSREEFVDLAESDGPAESEDPVVVRTVVDLDLDADIEPLEAYAALTGRTTDAADGEYTFLLESAEKVASSDPDGAFAPKPDDRHARYSFVGYDPKAVVTVDPDETDVDVRDERYETVVAPGDVPGAVVPGTAVGAAVVPDPPANGPVPSGPSVPGGAVGVPPPPPPPSTPHPARTTRRATRVTREASMNRLGRYAGKSTPVDRRAQRSGQRPAVRSERE